MKMLKRSVIRVVVLSLCTLGVPLQHARAELVATDQVESSNPQAASPRERLKALFDRADVRTILEQRGVSAEEAKSRVDALSDEEVRTLATRFDSLPAAGSGFETLLVVGFLSFVILLITDILGFTKVFSFTRPAK
jgi:hypothetical protein